MARPDVRGHSRAVSTAILVGALALPASPASAQRRDPAVAEAPPPPPTLESETRGVDARRETRLYFGMVTTHLKERSVSVHNNWLIAMSWRGFFGGTFVNSFGRRAFTAGLQRTLVSHVRGPLAASAGYRLGIVTGYDGRFMRLARDTPVLPLISAYGNVDFKHTGIEVSYTFVVVSVAMSYRF